MSNSFELCPTLFSMGEKKFMRSLPPLVTGLQTGVQVM